MEHKIFNRIRKYKIPLFLRILIMVILILLGFVFIILPFPGSAIIGWGIVILGFIFILKARDLVFVKKIRKGIFYVLKNFSNKEIREHKTRDIKRDIRKIINK